MVGQVSSVPSQGVLVGQVSSAYWVPSQGVLMGQVSSVPSQGVLMVGQVSSVPSQGVRMVGQVSSVHWVPFKERKAFLTPTGDRISKAPRHFKKQMELNGERCNGYAKQEETKYCSIFNNKTC